MLNVASSCWIPLVCYQVESSKIYSISLAAQSCIVSTLSLSLIAWRPSFHQEKRRFQPLNQFLGCYDAKWALNLLKKLFFTKWIDFPKIRYKNVARSKNRWSFQLPCNKFLTSAIAYIHCNFSIQNQFNSKRETNTELFQLWNQHFEVIFSKLTRVFFKDGLRDLGRRSVKQNDRGHILLERLRVMLESCWVSTHTLMPMCRAEKPSLTSPPVRPITSFEAVTVIKNYESVGSFKRHTGHFQVKSRIVLVAAVKALFSSEGKGHDDDAGRRW